jgi:hypothetical protein
VKFLPLWLFICSVSFRVLAQEQMALRINEKGIINILQNVIKYNTATKEGRTVVIPKNIYKFTLPKSQILSNPIVPILNEVSDINLTKDLNFYLNTSDIKITGDVDVKTLKTKILNSTESGFDLHLSLQFPKIKVNGTSLSLCEDKARGANQCGSGLKATLSKLEIVSTTRPVTLTAVLRLRTDSQVARVSLRSVSTNLDAKTAPVLNINFASITVPPISIVINGQETQLDTSRLRNVILEQKHFLAKKLLGFASDFLANDFVEMINIYLVNKAVSTTYQVYRKDNRPMTFNEFIDHQYSVIADMTYVRRPVYLPSGNLNSDPMKVMMEHIAEVIKNAQVDITLKRISTPGDKDVQLEGLLNFILNGRRMSVRNTLGNSNRALPKLDLNSQRNVDINLAISEPLINGALDLVNSTRLFQEIFEKLSPVPGFSIRSVKVHFQGDRALVAVVNAQVDLKAIESKGIGSWFKNKIAAWLERNNNNSVIFFPIEISVIPSFRKLPSGGMGLDLKVLSPFKQKSLPNRFNYPSNVPAMTETVREGVMDELEESLSPHTNKNYNVDLSKFLNQSGVVFLPKTLSINQGAYLLMGLDIIDINFNSLNPLK